MIATMVANSSDLTNNAWTTVSGTYAWSGYNVTIQSDYLEIDYYIDVISISNSNSVQLRIDDNTLNSANQTRAANIFLPATYDYVLRIANTATSSWQVRLKQYSDSNIGRLQNFTIYFHDSTGGATSSQIVIQNGTYTTQIGTWYSLGSSTTIYIANVLQANSTGTSYVYTYLEILTPGTTTYARYAVTFQVS